jgi:hypothetical protein
MSLRRTHRSLAFFALALALTFAHPALAAPKSAAPAAAPTTPAPAAFLPASFSGWTQSTNRVSANPADADAPNADVLKEYGFTSFQSATYSRDSDTLTIRAIRFQDASGAYGAFTFYRRPGTQSIAVGKSGAFDGQSHIIFWNHGTLIDAVFSHLTAMSASDLRDLATQIPALDGPAALLPTLPSYLPAADLNASTIRYALGPLAYQRAGGVLPDPLIDFARGAEAVTAQYNMKEGTGALTVINYPTPQIAADRDRAIDAYFKAGASAQPPFPQALADSAAASLTVRRTGPIVVVTTGNLTAKTSAALAGKVRYDADVTWNNPKGYVSEDTKTARLILGIFSLIAILLSVTVIMGLFFGGARAVIRKMRGKPVSSLEETDIIRLKI